MGMSTSLGKGTVILLCGLIAVSVGVAIYSLGGSAGDAIVNGLVAGPAIGLTAGWGHPAATYFRVLIVAALGFVVFGVLAYAIQMSIDGHAEILDSLYVNAIGSFVAINILIKTTRLAFWVGVQPYPKVPKSTGWF